MRGLSGFEPPASDSTQGLIGQHSLFALLRIFFQPSAHFSCQDKLPNQGLFSLNDSGE